MTSKTCLTGVLKPTFFYNFRFDHVGEYFDYTKHILQAPTVWRSAQKHGSSRLELNQKYWSFRFDVLSSRGLARETVLQLFMELLA